MNRQRRPAVADIDWQQIHAGLARTIAATREVLRPSPERAARVLEERARRLATPLTSSQPAGVLLDLLMFQLAGERYAIETRHVQEVVRFAGLTLIPGLPAIVAGVANLRGQILIVFDLRPMLGLTPQDAAKASRIVVCGDAEPDLGLLVDAASEVVRLPAHAVRADAVDAAGAGAKLIRGITRDATVVLDGAALLADQRLCIDQTRRP